MKNILKLKRKISSGFSQRDGGLYVDEEVDPEFSLLWSKLFPGHTLTPKQNVKPIIESKISGISIILNEIQKSGPVVLDVGDNSSSFELTFFPRKKVLVLGIFETTGQRALQRQIKTQRDAIELIDHAHQGVLFQVKRSQNGVMSLDFASPRLPEVMQIPLLTVDGFLLGMSKQTRKDIFHAFKQNDGKEEIFFKGSLDSPYKRLWNIRASILSAGQDGTTTFLGVLENNTEKEQQLEQIKYTSAFLRSITQNIPIGIAVSNIPKKHYLYVNQELCKITGYNEEDFLTGGLAFTRDTLILEMKKEFFNNLDLARDYYNSPQADSDHAFQGEIRIQTKEGNERHLRVSFRPLGDRSEDGTFDTFIHLSEDITERIQLEKERRKDEILLIQKNKMAELGEMASCLAHEINNPLSIMGHLLENLEARHKDDHEVKLTFQTLERISKIVKALTGFARDTEGQGPGDHPIPLSNILNDMLLLCQNRLTNKNIEFKITGDLNACPYINDTLLTQVFLNLVNNSYDILEHSTKEKWLKLEAKLDLQKLKIIFTDSGQAPEIEQMLSWFEPFYTSKEKGKGTGLGLFICQNLLRSVGGTIKPIANKNTCFQITLPLWPSHDTGTQN